METELNLRRKIKVLLILFIFLLVISGLTAFPLETELTMLKSVDFWPDSMKRWLAIVHSGWQKTNQEFPFMAYGTDWLAFAHLAIAVFFIGPLKDPVRNVWIIKAGMVISVGIFPLAFIAGSIRNIPFYWQLIDCSFGVFSFLLLNYCLALTGKLEQFQNKKMTAEFAAKPPLSCPFNQKLNGTVGGKQVA